MKTLIETIESWIDDRITNNIALDRADRMSHSATVDIQELDASIREMEKLHICDAERIATLERRMLELGDSGVEESTVTEEHTERLDDLADRVHTLESEMYAVESATEDIPDTYSIEVMIDDALETKVMDAVMAELDSIDFKVAVER